MLKAEALINDTIWTCASVHLTVFYFADLGIPAGEPPLMAQAQNLSALKRSTDRAFKALDEVPVEVREAPLVKTTSFYRQWLSSARTYREAVAAHMLETLGESLVEHSRALEAICPRWGSTVNDTMLRLDGAKVMLLLNPDIAGLPAQVRKLNGVVNMTESVVQRLGMPMPVDDLKVLREPVRLARNSLAFGIKTVNVAAAVKVVAQASPTKKQLEACMRMDLPQALQTAIADLLVDLEAPEQQPEVAATPKPKSSKGPPPPGLLRRARSGMSASEAPAAKRPKCSAAPADSAT